MRLLVTILFTVYYLFGCQSDNTDRIRLFKNYYTALKKNDESKWNYTSDSLYTWFDSKSNTPRVSIKGSFQKGKWAGWDSIMNSYSYYDSLWYNKKEDAVEGFFYERNDFYDLIGRPPNKTLRVYWFSEKNKIQGVLIKWIPNENKHSNELLLPIVSWAKKNHEAEINYLYANEEIVPSIENALRWKALLKKYHHFQDSLNSTSSNNE